MWTLCAQPGTWGTVEIRFLLSTDSSRPDTDSIALKSPHPSSTSTTDMDADAPMFHNLTYAGYHLRYLPVRVLHPTMRDSCRHDVHNMHYGFKHPTFRASSNILFTHLLVLDVTIPRKIPPQIHPLCQTPNVLHTFDVVCRFDFDVSDFIKQVIGYSGRKGFCKLNDIPST